MGGVLTCRAQNRVSRCVCARVDLGVRIGQHSKKARSCALFALSALLGCAQRTNQAQSPDELMEEARVIAVASRAQMAAGDNIACVSRGLVANRNFNHLDTDDLAQLGNRIGPNPGPVDPDSLSERRLDDRTIVQVTGQPSAGTSCTGLTFLTFSRVQFMGQIALALADKNTIRTCSRRTILFRLQQVDGEWRVTGQREGDASSAFTCGQSPHVETRNDYFQVGN